MMISFTTKFLKQRNEGHSCNFIAFKAKRIQSVLSSSTLLSAHDDLVVHRVKYLLNDGFGCYNVFKNNCEDFAIYCKTGLLVLEQSSMGQRGQAVSTIGGPLAAVLSTPLHLATTNVYGMAATAVGVYCVSRYAADIGMRRDVVKMQVEDLNTRLASGALRVASPALLALPSAPVS